jgi:hypothetical protein
MGVKVMDVIWVIRDSYGVKLYEIVIGLMLQIRLIGLEKGIFMGDKCLSCYISCS